MCIATDFSRDLHESLNAHGSMRSASGTNSHAYADRRGRSSQRRNADLLFTNAKAPSIFDLPYDQTFRRSQRVPQAPTTLTPTHRSLTKKSPSCATTKNTASTLSSKTKMTTKSTPRLTMMTGTTPTLPIACPFLLTVTTTILDGVRHGCRSGLAGWYVSGSLRCSRRILVIEFGAVGTADIWRV